VAAGKTTTLGAERDARASQSSIAVPMLVRGRALGAFEVQSIEPGALTAEHVAAMQMAGHLAAIATQNVLLIERERQLRAVAENSEHRFRNLVQGLDAIVWEADAATLRYTFVSPQAEALLGYPVAEWLGEPAFLLKHTPTAQRDEISALRDTALRSGQGVLEYPVKSADGSTVWLRESLRVVRDSGDGAGQARGFLLDVTERKELENQLRQAQKMEAVGRLAGGVAHDFNNMLAVITGYCELILQSGPVEDRLSFALQEIRKAGERACSLTQQLLAFSRQSIVTHRVLDLNAVIRSAEGMLRRLIGEDIEIETTLDRALGHVTADPGQMTQMILNLAVNARDAMPQGGTLKIETRSVTLTRAQSRRYPDVAPGPYALLTVRDTGVGMDAAAAARIFEPFFTTKEVGKGTGLGLSTVHGIVKQSGGHIEVDTAPGGGAAFTIYLPTVREKQAAAGDRRGAGEAPAGSETILVVEDEDQVRMLVTRALRHQGYNVLEGADAREALNIARQQLEPIDLLLTDVVMPGMGGPQLARRLAETHPEARVLYMSGYTDDDILRHGVLAREVAFIQKPFAPQDLAIQVRRLLDKE
jgi:PAS domain S-box-containing protein